MILFIALKFEVIMKAASINHIKEELGTMPPEKVLGLCMRLVKYKKDNKELLSYLLFNAHDQEAFISDIKNEIDEQFAGMNMSTLYYEKKTLRKILRSINKYIRYSGSKQVETELLIYFCGKIKHSGIPISTSIVLSNLYFNQLNKIKKALSTLHEDLQCDYKKDMETLL